MYGYGILKEDTKRDTFEEGINTHTLTVKFNMIDTLIRFTACLVGYTVYGISRHCTELERALKECCIDILFSLLFSGCVAILN